MAIVIEGDFSEWPFRLDAEDLLHFVSIVSVAAVAQRLLGQLVSPIALGGGMTAVALQAFRFARLSAWDTRKVEAMWKPRRLA